MPPIAELWYLLEYYILVLFVKIHFFDFERAHQPGFEPRSPGPKAATLTIELHSIDNSRKFLYLNKIK